MNLRDLAQHDPCVPISSLIASVALSACLVLAGCGSGVVASLQPAVPKAAIGIPSGPTLGWVFSSNDGSLRPILGVRGSAQVSASIVPSDVYVAGEVSTASSVGLLEDATRTLFAFNLPLPQPIHIADGLPAHAQIVFAPSGQTAIVYATGGSTMTLIKGLPTAPLLQTRTVTGGRLVSAAVSDAGTIATVMQGTPMPVGTLAASGQFSTLTTVAAPGGLSFIPGSEDLLIADGGANTATLMHNVSGGASIQPLTVTGLNQPVAIAGSQDKKWAVIADGGDANIFRVDLTTGIAATKLTCACQPALLSSLAGGGAFRVNSLYGGPTWTVDLTGATPQLLFVPAIAKGAP
jgi:hypothetical protein